VKIAAGVSSTTPGAAPLEATAMNDRSHLGGEGMMSPLIIFLNDID
jgi:hypothetical protein